jgi:hypothetical protein
MNMTATMVLYIYYIRFTFNWFDFIVVTTIKGLECFFPVGVFFVASTSVPIHLSMGIIPVGVNSRAPANMNNIPGHR